MYLNFTIPAYRKTSAQEIAGSSAGVIYTQPLFNQERHSEELYKVKKTLFKVFERYNSPLINEVDTFINVCVKYNIDCYLLPSIAGLESTFGKYIYPNSFNPFGWGGGYIVFNSWKEAIEEVGFKLKKNYIDKGLIEVEMIGNLYSESPSWSLRIKNFIKYFERVENEISLLFFQNEVKL